MNSRNCRETPDTPKIAALDIVNLRCELVDDELESRDLGTNRAPRLIPNDSELSHYSVFEMLISKMG